MSRSERLTDLVLYIHGKGGGHWFHTEEQMKFLDEFLLQSDF